MVILVLYKNTLIIVYIQTIKQYDTMLFLILMLNVTFFYYYYSIYSVMLSFH